MKSPNRWYRATAMAVAAVGVVTTHANADSVARPAGVRVTQQDWIFVPVVVQGLGSPTVPGVLAIRDKSAAVGENIVAVWYENPQAVGTEWPAKSWESQDPWEAINWVKQEQGIGDEYDVLWPTSDPKTASNPTEIPKNYVKGLLTMDPLAELASQPEGDQLVEILTAIGYQSASISVDKSGPCDTKVILAALADTTVFAVLARPAFTQVESRFASLVPATCAQVVPPPPPPPPPVIPGTTTPQPGTPLSPGAPWQRDTTPPRGDPTCSTATTCCYAEKIIWLYTKTNWLGLTVIRYCESEISYSCPAPAGVPPAPCPATPPCSAPPGPYFPPPPLGPLPAGSCEIDYY